jgi:hypothetical protein
MGTGWTTIERLRELRDLQQDLGIDLDLEVQDQHLNSSGTITAERQERGVCLTDKDRVKRLDTLMESMISRGLRLELEDLI